MNVIATVAIIGGGFSGTLQAINLLRHEGPRAILIEQRPDVGRGVAYSAAHPSHLLNVRAGNMSALPDEPNHFVRWLDERGLSHLGAFVPRIVYGQYLAELLDDAHRHSAGRLDIVQGEAVSLDADCGVSVSLRDGRRIRADAAVLALGNLPPEAPEGLDPTTLGPGRYLADPWAANLASGLKDSDHVVILGTGLTMIDAVLQLDAQGFSGIITALSRRGLVPRPHRLETHGSPLGNRPSGELSALLAAVRQRSSEVGWRAAIDALRPHTQSIWLAATPDQRRRFLRHLRPWWDVHRHRTAPEVAARIDGIRTANRLRIVAGRPTRFTPSPAGISVEYVPRGATAPHRMSAARIVNCTGPRTDLSRTTFPLLHNLVEHGLVRSDPLGLGLDVDKQARLLDAHGNTHANLFALGPMTRGAFWEITAVPDIRVQTWTLARQLSNAHWVAWEGL
jgi:uncharacterized NAD(P)/FAD-binding protein YdhS